MAFTLIGFHESVAASTLTKITALADEHIRVSGDDIVVPELNKIIGALFMSPNMANGELSSPSLRRMWLEDVLPILQDSKLPTTQAVNEGGTDTYNIPRDDYFMNLVDNPLILEQSEKLNVLVDNGGNAEDNLVLVWLSDSKNAPVKGEIHRIKATASKTLTSYAWTNGAITFEQTLPAGRYAVVGMRAKSTSLIAARLVFVGESWRPGVLGQKAYSDDRPKIFEKGNLGTFGEFEFDQPPTIDFLASAADTSEEVWLDLVQVRAGR